jgi:hypothetical protein
MPRFFIADAALRITDEKFDAGHLKWHIQTFWIGGADEGWGTQDGRRHVANRASD